VATITSTQNVDALHISIFFTLNTSLTYTCQRNFSMLLFWRFKLNIHVVKTCAYSWQIRSATQNITKAPDLFLHISHPKFANKSISEINASPRECLPKYLASPGMPSSTSSAPDKISFDHNKVNELQHEQMEAKVLHSLTGSITILKAEHSTTSSPEFIHFALPNSSLLRYWWMTEPTRSRAHQKKLRVNKREFIEV
jgi:hypothetical protein